MQKPKTISIILCIGALLLSLPISGWSQATEVTRLYFVRHGEDTTALRETGKSGVALIPECEPFINDDGMIDFCCLEILNPLGAQRAKLLAQWFADQQILPAITHVFSTYKTRTLQTVLPTAQAAGLDDLAMDVDKNAGDGVQQVPAFVEECDAGFESPSSSLHLVVAAILQVPSGSTVVVCGHSSTLYPMMEMLGINTSDPTDFPRRPNGKVDGFNNLWIIDLAPDLTGTFVDHLQLDFTLATTAP